MNKAEYNKILERKKAHRITDGVYPEGYIITWRIFFEDTLFYIEENRECGIYVQEYYKPLGNIFIETIKAIIMFITNKPHIYEIHTKSIKQWDNGIFINESEKKMILDRIINYLNSLKRSKIIINDN
jgi:hypothetical protein